MSRANAAKTHCPAGHPYDRTDKNGRRTCSICRGEARARHRERRGPGADTARVQDWQRRNPEKVRASYLRRHYGITLEDEKRLREAQGDRCAGCGEPEPKNVDHCHATGVVRGLLCTSCNRTLGLVRDRPETLRALAEYLEESLDRSG